MGFTYSDPSSSDRDCLRFIVGDTLKPRRLTEDEELDYLLDAYGDSGGATRALRVRGAVLPAVDAMLARCAGQGDWSSGGESESASQRVKNLERLRGRLVTQGYPEPEGVQVTSTMLYLTREDGDPVEYESA